VDQQLTANKPKKAFGEIDASGEFESYIGQN
jgi:hypothetical protein